MNKYVFIKNFILKNGFPGIYYKFVKLWSGVSNNYLYQL